MIAVRVEGGTGAGTKRPPKERWWTHCCPPVPVFHVRDTPTTVTYRSLSSYSCPHCGTRRPTTSEDK